MAEDLIVDDKLHTALDSIIRQFGYVNVSKALRDFEPKIDHTKAAAPSGKTAADAAGLTQVPQAAALGNRLRAKDGFARRASRIHRSCRGSIRATSISSHGWGHSELLRDLRHRRAQVEVEGRRNSPNIQVPSHDAGRGYTKNAGRPDVFRPSQTRSRLPMPSGARPRSTGKLRPRETASRTASSG